MERKENEPLYRLLLVGICEGKLFPAISGLREIFDHSLGDAKRATDAMPCELASGLFLEEAERLAAEMAQNSAMTEIAPDETSTEHNGDFREVVCPACGFPNLKLIRYWPEGLLAYLPRDFGRRHHVCHACGEKFTTPDRPE